MLSDIPPIVTYDAADARGTADSNDTARSAVRKFTVFAAIATSPAPKEEGCCGTCSVGSPEPYEWCSVEHALMLLRSEVERACLLKMVQAVAEAAHAGLLAT